MELDPSVIASLPLAQRQRLMNQMRREQIRRHNEWMRKNPISERSSRLIKHNKKGSSVKFEPAQQLSDADTCYDDRQVLELLNNGVSPNLANATGISLLHRCCITDNLSVAEILINHGADVNARDQDLWTPLHCACECNNTDLVTLLLANGADPLLLDVDDNLAVDHTAIDSPIRTLLDHHLQDNGSDPSQYTLLRKSRAKSMLGDIKELIETPGATVNLENEDGITLLHIACANGYKEVAKLLIANKANLNAQDNNGLTPLHVAAKFNQTKMVQLLIKHLADPTIRDDLGRAPVDITLNEYIVGRLAEYEKDRPPGSPPTSPVVDIEEGIYDFELEAPREPTKSVSPDINISKIEELMEAKHRLEQLYNMPGSPEPVESGSEVSPYVEEENPFNFSPKADAVGSPGFFMELPPRIATDDLISLPEISESIILGELSKRYNDNRIYTCIGDILVAVNPFQPLSIHQRAISHKYNQVDELRSLPSHIFATAERAYRAMKVEKRSQCCIVSGESGAGKTESSKYTIQHLLTVATSDETNLNARIEQVNPLLEAFGNAQTVMNDNSSRFGKYLEVMFSEEGAVQGAKIYEYLLEKSRVVYQSPDETNFHIFYLMFAGVSPDEKKKYQLGSAKAHRYLRSHGDKIDDLLGSESLEKFRELKDCLRFIGFSTEDIDNLFVSLSAVLHLGDVTFKPVGNNDSAQISNPDTLEKVATLLQVPVEDLASSLEAEITLTRGEHIRKERSLAQAADCRDALAKSIYSRLFSWIVNSINQLIQPLEATSVGVEIGILDIFGFENFPKNSFEQICINLANEQLQYLFNKGIFETELKDCQEEGLTGADLRFTSNMDIIEMFLSKPQGILAVLDEQSRFPKATDQSLATKLHDGPGRTYSKRYLAPKDRGTTFAVLHYAGHVVYQLDGVLDKNKETLPASILFTMKTSSSLVIKEMFRSRLTRVGSLAPSTRQRRSRKGKKGTFEFFGRQKSTEEVNKPLRRKADGPVVGTDRKGPSTAAYHFKNSLADLMSKMSSATPHFIRCLKPNIDKTANNFNMEYVRAQLLYTGILQTVEIRKQGFPLRLTFEEFLSRYELLAARHIPIDSKASVLDKCKRILKSSRIDDYRVGKTKLFFRYEQTEILSGLTEDLYRKVILVQTVIRSWIGQMHHQELRRQAVQQTKTVNNFLNNISLRCEALHSKLLTQSEDDVERQKKADREEEKRMLLEEQDRRIRENEGRKRLSKAIEANDCDKDFDVGGDGVDTMRGLPTRASIGIRRTDEISQSLLALDQVIDEYDPYSFTSNNNNIGEIKSQPLDNQGDDDDKDSNDSRNEEIRKSIEALDSVLDAYDDDSPLDTADQTKRASQVVMRGNAQNSPQSGLLRHPRRSKTEDSEDLPPPPPELLHDNGRPHSIHSTSGTELYARSSKRNSRAPPQVPRRNPETRLSSGSSESQELDVGRFALQDVSGLDSGYGTEQDYPQKPQTYHAGYGDTYYGHTNGDVIYHGQQHQSLGGGAPPSPPIPPGGSLPPPIPPGGGRNGLDGGRTMPAYSAPQHQHHHHQYPDTNGLESIVPPPPPGFDMGANVSAPGEELYETKLPPRLDTMPPQTIESHYGVQLPQPGMDNGYPSPHELYETTLPRPMGMGYVEQQQQQRAPPPVLRRGSSSSSGSNKNSYSSGSTRDTSIGPEYSLNTPVPAPSMVSPDSEFPPPPPPQFFNTMPSAPSSAPGSGPGSPVRPPPPTLPKPKGKTSQPPTPPLNGMPPPPAPMLPNTMPRIQHNNHVNAPPTPPPLSTMPRAPPAQTDASKLAQQLANIQLRTSPPEDKPSKSPSTNAHSDLISQIHVGVTLRQSPAGKKIRVSDELGGVRVVEDCGDSFSETASVTSSGSGEDYSGSSTGSRPPPPTLPKPNKPSPIHTNTMPSGGSETNNSALAGEDFDPYDGEEAGIYEKIIDVTQLDGYQEVPEDCPAWKRAMVERKNKQLEESMRREFNDRKAEENKWRGVPDWKKNLIKEKEKKRGDELAPQEEESKRRMEEEAKLAGMPEWKRNLLLKKRGDI